MAGIFRLLKMQYMSPKDPHDISFAGKIVILTGATSGLGYEAAIKFLNLGVESLVIGCRDVERGNITKAQLEKSTNRQDVIQVWELDMNSFDSVKNFANRVNADLPRVDVALLNAGVLNRDYAVTPEGWEETLQVNTLSTSLLAILLLPKLRLSSTATEPTHLTAVSSQQFVRVRPESFPSEGPLLAHVNQADQFKGPKQYAMSKLLLEYAMKTIADLACTHQGYFQVIVNTVSPGFCASSLGRKYDQFYMRCLSWFAYKLLARTAEQGSRSLVSATVQGIDSHGRCWRSDDYLDESKALTSGPKGDELQAQAWQEIMGVMEEQAGEVRIIAQRI
ncbi:short-chain dehydrogenase/reductase family protein [Penicillium argentinense]|uniref:Short-chain dehydrogenase/reductase family protein n=1 Tax=Penicillium argentinense TaxID=1131581 RepID=A0A9W9KLN8_9EURO|nr:short-chain dehydrogenase/reductase family protein [Penicillium argentinense]KAJ5111329.1 short-chain dehydrogenase/reductase family protein [Penicillium argentinense]